MNFRPPEWQQNKEIWLAWPYDGELWREELAGAQQEFLALVLALHKERLTILVPNQQEEALLKAHLSGVMPNFVVMSYGDIWLRDTLPIYIKDQQGHNALVIPRFNGWGNKYDLMHDRGLSKRVATLLSMPAIESNLVFEGGAIECDGQGLLLTTESCLLNKNRNPKLSKEEIEAKLKALFGVSKIFWLKEGLLNDHTDGHIDTIARFIAPSQLAIMMPREKNDPNYTVLHDIKDQLLDLRDVHGHPINLIELPSTGRVANQAGEIMPASFLNFIIGDHSIVMPTYATPYDQEAREILQAHSNIPVVAASAKSILNGGGAFHCISQEFYGR